MLEEEPDESHVAVDRRDVQRSVACAAVTVHPQKRSILFSGCFFFYFYLNDCYKFPPLFLLLSSPLHSMFPFNVHRSNVSLMWSIKTDKKKI